MTIRILLPPSEGKADGGDTRHKWNPRSRPSSGPLHTVTAIGSGRAEVARALKAVGGGDSALLGVTGAHLERARRANSSLVGAPSMPAWERYTGVVWDHLQLATLSAVQRRRALTSLFVISALGGLVRSDELLPDYRLKMSARLSPLGQLAAWWRPTVTAALATIAARSTIVDLLPQEHRAAIDWTALSEVDCAVVRIELVARTSGAAGGHHAKAAKGLFARHLLLTGDVRRAARTFRHPQFTARATSVCD